MIKLRKVTFEAKVEFTVTVPEEEAEKYDRMKPSLLDKIELTADAVLEGAIESAVKDASEVNVRCYVSSL